MLQARTVDSIAAPAPLRMERIGPWLPTVVWVALGIAAAVFLWRYVSEKHRQRTTEQLASAPMGMAFAVLALVAGSISQFYSDTIKDHPPLAFAGEQPAWAAQAFWFSVVVTAVVGIAYYAASGRLRRQELHTLQSHTSSLVDTLRTLPPEGFMRDYPRLCSAMMGPYTKAVLTSADPHVDAATTEQEVRKAIRTALRTAAEMAKSFDRGNRPERYSANVMRYHPRENLAPLSEWSEGSWDLYPQGFRPQAIQGALVLDPSLASYADTDAPVAGLAPIRIVIPDPPRDAPVGTEAEGKLRIIPGGGLAHFLGDPYNATDTWSIRESEEGRFSLPEAVLGATERYFRRGPGRTVRSFVSLPLFAQPGALVGERVGVLNVESSEPDIFGGDDEKVRQFALVIAPVHFVIVSLLALLPDLAETALPAAPAAETSGEGRA